MKKDRDGTTSRFIFGGAGFLALAASQFLWIDFVPAWHLDEAWAALYANRIAIEPHFWPIQAMVPYTVAWLHYLSAFIFKIFGPSVTAYRATGGFEVILGIILISLSLWKAEEKRAAVLLPWVAAFFPALVINQRWVIDMNTFHVFCVGILSLGMVFRWKKGPVRSAYLLIGTGAFLGVTSHIVFFGPLLALWGCLFLDGKIIRKEDRFFGIGFLSSLLPFLIWVLHQSEDRFQVKALIGLVLVLLAFHFLPFFWINPDLTTRVRKGQGGVWNCAALKSRGFFCSIKIQNLKKILFLIPSILGIPLLIPFLIFSEGSWLALFSVGFLEVSSLRGLILIPCGLAVFFILRSGWRPKSLAAVSFLPACWLLITLMVVKPGPRYYEIVFLGFAVILALAISRLKPREAWVVGVLWTTIGGLQLGLNYFEPILLEKQVDKTFRFLRFRDSSGDFISKRNLIKKFAEECCQYSDLDVPDERLNLNLKFLSLGDWPPLKQNCFFRKQENKAPIREAGPVCRLGSKVRVSPLGENDPVPQVSDYVLHVGQFLIERSAI